MDNIAQARLDWWGLWLELSEVEANLKNLHTGTRNGEKFEADASGLARRAKTLLTETISFLWPSRGMASRLAINTRQLAAFLVCKIEEGRQHGEIPENTVLGGAVEGVGLAERLMFCKRLTVVTLLGLGAHASDYDSLRSLLWLVCEYGHEALGLDRRIDLEKHLGLLAMEQPALYGLKRFYRDHLNHVIQDCLLGWLLLETHVNAGGKRFWEFLQGVGTQNEILRQWFLAALLHDVGYVVEVGKGWAGLLELFDNASFNRVREGTLREIGVLREIALCKKDWGFAAEDQPEFDHGVVSAIHAQEMLDSLGSQKPVGDFNAAIKAIARHNHWRARIDYAREPLSALLVLCDEVQEWDRPWIYFDRAALALTAGVLYRNSQDPGWHEDLSEVSVNIQTKWEDQRLASILARNDNILEFEIKYTDQIHYQDKVFATWVGRSEKLQRLNLNEAPFDVRYRIVTELLPPPGLGVQSSWETRMERLRRLVRTKQQWCLYDWLPKAAVRGGARPIDTYGVEYRRDEQEEEVLLSARMLGNVRPIAGSLEKFWKAVGEWDEAREVREPEVW